MLRYRHFLLFFKTFWVGAGGLAQMVLQTHWQSQKTNKYVSSVSNAGKTTYAGLRNLGWKTSVLGYTTCHGFVFL